MAEIKYSCIKQVVKTVQIPLPATFISNEISGIAEILESWKRQYKKQLQGVVVNYRHYSLSSPTGFIAPNKPFVYYNVKATFDVFCPSVGDIVKGKINRISKEHIGCLIEETINATIHLSKDSSQDLSPFINLHREILFEISSFNYDRKMIRVTGKITPKCIQLMKELFPSQAFSSVIDTPEISNNTDEGIGTSNESTDDGLLNHTFDDSRIKNDDGNFKKPFSSGTKSKKQLSKRLENESSSMDSSAISSSDEKSKKKKKKHNKTKIPKNCCESSSVNSSDDEKPKKKKKKHNDKTHQDTGNHLNVNSLSNTVSSDTLIENFSAFNHVETKVLKEEVSFFEDNTRIKKHKKKRKQDSSPSLIGESTQSNNYILNGDMSNFASDNSEVNKTDKLSKKRKRESESSFVDTSEQSTADEMPKKKKCKDESVPLLEKEIKDALLNMPLNDIIPAELSTVGEKPKNKKKHKDKNIPLLNNGIRNELLEMPDDNIATILSLKREIFSPIRTINSTVPESKKKKKNKDKKSKERNKPKKKKGKVHASGTVLKRDKKSRKKGSKKNKVDGEQSKKHKKSKSHKKDTNEKKKKKDNPKIKKVSDIKSEID